jgi:hypothetical protein
MTLLLLFNQTESTPTVGSNSDLWWRLWGFYRNATMIIDTDTTDQSIRFWAYDSDGAAVTGEAHDSDGMAASVVVRRKGRIASTTSLTLVARSGSGVHTDSALTEVGSGEYVVDLPDSYFATAGDYVSLTVASTAITGTVVVESLTVADPVDNAGIREAATNAAVAAMQWMD